MNAAKNVKGQGVGLLDIASRHDEATSSTSAMDFQENDPLLDGNEQAPPSYFETEDERTAVTTTPQPLPPGDLDSRVVDWTHENASGSIYTRISPSLSTDPVALKRYIDYAASVCPRSYVHVKGWHRETHRAASGQKTRHTVLDFDFKIDATDTYSSEQWIGTSRSLSGWNQLCVVPNEHKTYRGTQVKRLHKQPQGNAEGLDAPSLDEWCHLFCASNAILKSFTLHRVIANRDEDLIRNEIISYIRSMSYRGNIAINFPLHTRTETIQSPHVINRLRNNWFCYWFFIITQLWIFTWPALFFMTKRWAVVDSYWNYKRISRDGEWEYFKENESDWCRRWRYTIQRSVLETRCGQTEVRHIQEPSIHEQNDQLDGIIRARQLQRGLFNIGVPMTTDFRIVMERETDAGWGYNT